MTAVFEWGAAVLPQPGESESGDRYVMEVQNDLALVAVVDALGHGHEAASVAAIAAEALKPQAGESLDAVLRRCHQRLLRTRGATISAALIDLKTHTVSWLGVGDVAGVLVYADPRAQPRLKALLVRAGVVGDHLPDLRPMMLKLAPGDTLILASDGIHRRFTESLTATRIPPQRLADRILATYARGDDDATVAVFRLAWEVSDGRG